MAYFENYSHIKENKLVWLHKCALWLKVCKMKWWKFVEFKQSKSLNIGKCQSISNLSMYQTIKMVLLVK